jgi:uncharacterized protein (TIGR01777 family)
VKVAVTGSRGLVGSALVVYLRQQGHEVVPVVRGEAQSGEVVWDPGSGTLNPEHLSGVDAVVHLAGAGVADHRWSASYKEMVRASRTGGTSTLCRALAAMPGPPPVLLSGSAVGYYGVRGDEVLTEDSGAGSGFLADLCVQWEAATAPAAEAGIRVVHLRTGVVLSAAGGALKKQLPLFRLGLGARLGSGRQQFSWITRRDMVAALAFLLTHQGVSGPVNMTAPGPISNAEFTRALGRSLGRPAALAVPAVFLRAVVGTEMATEFLLASQRALPHELTAAGFEFADADIAAALGPALADGVLVPT